MPRGVLGHAAMPRGAPWGAPACPDAPRPPPGVVEPVDVADNGDGTQRVSYVPSREGPYSISVRYGDEEVPRR